MRILGVISDFVFLQKKFTHKKAHKMQTSDFDPDVSIRPESIKMQTSNFYS